MDNSLIKMVQIISMGTELQKEKKNQNNNKTTKKL